MKKFISFFLMGGLLLMSHSCYYDQELILPEAPEVPDDVVISFSDDIEPLFSQSGRNCTGCHNGTIANPDLRAGNAYSEILPLVIPEDAEGSRFYQNLPGNGQHANVGFVLTPAEIALIKGWIDRGAENN